MKTALTDYDDIVYIPEDYEYRDNVLICRKYRNVASLARCDAAIFISGRWGTLNEFSIAFDIGKILGLYTGEGKFSKVANSLVDLFQKQSKSIILCNDDPIESVNQIGSKIEQIVCP